MKKNLFAAILLLLGSGSRHPLAAQALDPGFTASAIYSPGTVYSALEQPDGKRVVVGGFSRVNGTTASSLVRLSPTGVLDAAFQQNLGTVSAVYRAGLLANGQLLLTGFDNVPVVAGGLTRTGLLRLNADGTGDAAFNAGTGPSIGGQAGSVDYALPLPNGQVLAVGYFDSFNGSPAGNVVRLNASGTVDATLNAGSGADDEVLAAVALPTGKFLVGGFFTAYNGTTRYGLARLNADGSLDPTFNTGFAQYDAVYNLAVQPDGSILVGGFVTVPGGNQTGLCRLLPNGAFDNSFNPPASLPFYSIYSFYGNAFEVQPDGKILFLSNPVGSNGGTSPGLGRLNANGSFDASFQPGTGPNFQPFSLTRLASGAVLATGSFTDFSGIADRSLVQLGSTGSPDPTFRPLMQAPGQVSQVVRQPDGKLLVGGSFSEINGQTVRRLARFNADGTPDAGFGLNTSGISSLAGLVQQPDGRILVATAASVRRYLGTGSPDNSFAAFTTPVSTITQLLLQADGRVIVNSNNFTSGANGLRRLLADGTPDASFAPSFGGSRVNYIQALALQPNGKLLLAANLTPNTGPPYRTVLRLESTGAPDATFASSPITSPFSINTSVNDLVVQPDGKVLVGGQFTALSGTARTGLARLNADGTPDTGFAPPALAGTVFRLLVQPNNRILVGGSFTSTSLPANLARLLPTGAADATYGATAVPSGTVRALLVQPDGNIVLGGGFTRVNGLVFPALARLTASNVLHVRAPQAVADRTAAWPVPAHGTLTVAPDASAHPEALDLLDALGRAVRHQELRTAAPAELSIENLPAGTYLLRVRYAEGSVTRRVQVQ